MEEAKVYHRLNRSVFFSSQPQLSAHHVSGQTKKGWKAVTVNNHVGGKIVSPSTGQYQQLINPADGSVNGQVALSSAQDVDAAVAVAKKAFEGWSRTPVKQRVSHLFHFRQLMLAHMDELSDLIVREHGKNKAEAIGSIQKGLETVEYACSLPQLMAGRLLEVSSGVHCHDVRQPLGVVASIVPFNFPVMVPFWTLPIAIATGNTIIIKPSEKVPLTLYRLIDLLHESGVPAGVVNLVNGKEAVVTALCQHPDIQAVSFVGSSKVAQIVSRTCRAHDKRVLALGAAKNHLVALPDCNVDMCSTDIVNSFAGCTGQRCMAASALVLVKDQSQLLQMIVKKAAALKPGQNNGEVGPVIDLAAQQRIIGYIDQAQQSGAKILLDGRSWAKQQQKGFWVGPTVILHSNRNDAALKEEIFGPVLSIIVVDSKEEAIAIENSSPYGNAACVYTTVGAHAEWFTQRFSAGMVGVNIGVPVPREPFSFGGWKASRYGDMDITGDGGVEFWTQRRKVTSKWTPPSHRSHGDWMS